MKHAMFLLLLAAASAAFCGEPPEVSVTLELPYASVLPGVPFDMNVVYRNLSSRTVAIGVGATVIITPENGKPVRMQRYTDVKREDGVQTRGNFELQPGEIEKGFISWNANFWADDAAYTVPGTYGISLELKGNPDAMEEGTVYAGTVHTTTARLVRIEPEGEDAVVWKRMQAAGNGRCPSSCFAWAYTREAVGEEVIAKHPKSAYYPYALLLTQGSYGDRLDLLQDAIDRFRDSPAYPNLLVTAGSAAYRQADKAERRAAPFAEVEDFLEIAASFFERAQETGSARAKRSANLGLSMANDRIERLRHPFVPH